MSGGMSGAVLVTGSSSGIGLEAAVYLAQKGLRVVATMRDPKKRGDLDAAALKAGTSIDVIALDVTNPESVSQAVADVIARYGSIDVVVNNAGILIRGYFEDCADDEVRRIFETNLFGTMAVTRAVLPHMRQARRGRVVLISSVGGLIGAMGLVAYSASKFAMEGFGEALALEVAPFGIDVSLIEPGNINTAMWNDNLQFSRSANNPASPYHALFVETEKLAAWAVKTSPVQAVDVARAIYHASTAKRPKRRYLIGYRPAAFLMARRLLPQEFFERMYTRAVLSKLKNAAR